MNKAQQLNEWTSPEGPSLGASPVKPNRHERRAQEAWQRRVLFVFPGRKLGNIVRRKMEA
jgi:hypothetical protein